MLYVSCATPFLFSFVVSFLVFDALEFSLNCFFTLVAFDKKENAVPLLAGYPNADLIDSFGLAKTK